MSRPTQRFPSTEWDFAAVPEAELTACLFYEYARESPRIRQARFLPPNIARHG